MQKGFNEISLEMWESFSENYSNLQNNPAVFTLALLNMLRVNEATNILDAGCGSGYLHQYLITKKRKECKVTAFDFSPQMVQRTAARMKKYLTQKEFGSLDNLTQQEVDQVKLDEEVFKTVNFELSVANIEQLDNFPNSQFDLYYSSLVYQLIENQDKALAEAFRVLKPGGKFGIVIWGAREDCTALNLLSDTLVEAGLIPQNPHSGYLNDKSVIIEKVKKQGFVNILCWQQSTAFDILEEGDALKFANPQTIQLLKTCPPEKKAHFDEIIRNKMQAKKALNEPFQFGCIIVTAIKPQ